MIPIISYLILGVLIAGFFSDNYLKDNDNVNLYALAFFYVFIVLFYPIMIFYSLYLAIKVVNE